MQNTSRTPTLFFRLFVFLLFVAIFSYTVVVVSRHGWGLIPIFFGDIQLLDWPGQFNLDFLCYLLLSALWIAWRHQFSGLGIFLALVASVAGMCFFAPYLLTIGFQEKGNMRRILMGTNPSV